MQGHAGANGSFVETVQLMHCPANLSGPTVIPHPITCWIEAPLRDHHHNAYRDRILRHVHNELHSCLPGSVGDVNLVGRILESLLGLQKSFMGVLPSLHGCIQLLREHATLYYCLLNHSTATCNKAEILTVLSAGFESIMRWKLCDYEWGFLWVLLASTHELRCCQSGLFGLRKTAESRTGVYKETQIHLSLTPAISFIFNSPSF